MENLVSFVVLVVPLIHSTFYLACVRPESVEPLHFFNPIGSKATVCAFTYIPGVIVTGHESGKVALFDVKTGDEIQNNERAHMDVVTDLQLSKDRSYIITSSKDKTARVSSCVKWYRRFFFMILTDPRYQKFNGHQDLLDGDSSQQCLTCT